MILVHVAVVKNTKTVVADSSKEWRALSPPYYSIHILSLSTSKPKCLRNVDSFLKP